MDIAGEVGALGLSGRRILITGAASGIGAATARLFAASGAELALVDRDETVLDLASELPNATGIARSLDKPADGASVIETSAHRMQGLDGLVNCAGADFRGSIAETDETRWERLISINLAIPYFMIRAAAPLMLEAGGGTIVNVASTLGLRPTSMRAAYCASKAGVIMLSKSLAAELGPTIRVNAVCPGATDTPMMKSSLPEGVDLDQAAQIYALRALSRPGDIAHSILFMTSSASCNITGVALASDGGHSFH